jgi:glutathione S-transferase
MLPAHPLKEAVMLKIWGRKNSSNVRKPLWAAEELGLAYEAIDAGGALVWSTRRSTAR